MALSEKQQFLRKRAARALGTHRVDQAIAKVRAIIGPVQLPQSEIQAQSALDKLHNGESPSAEELMALEIVVRVLRPVVFCRNGSLDDLPDQPGKNLQPQDLKDQWSSFRGVVAPFLHSIGRIEDETGEHVGSGFLVKENLLATNRHVLGILSFGTDVLQEDRARVVFKGEKGSTDPPEHIVSIKGVAAVHDTLDMALLSIQPADMRPPLELASSVARTGDRIVALGYPADDRHDNPLFFTATFPPPWGVKRAALGEVLDNGSDSNLFHDCSTLGGNSGSPLLSLETGQVTGIHRSGFFMYRNEAVPAEQLKTFVNQNSG